LKSAGRRPRKAQSFQQLVTPRFARNPEPSARGDMNLDLVAFFQPERFDDGRRKAHGQAMSPPRDLHLAVTSAANSLFN